MSDPCIRPACRALNTHCGCNNSRQGVCARCGKAAHQSTWCPMPVGQPGPYEDDGDQ